ncbi:MAG TPA: cytochrome c oxidase assembly protein [Gemmatimonadaceae bacterium]
MAIHALHHPGDALWTRWMTDPSAVIPIAMLAGVYAGGTCVAWRHAGRGRSVRRWQVWCFAGGLLTLVIALASPLDAAADRLFSAHMAQHVLLAIVAPPLLVAGAPLTAALWLLPLESRKDLVQWIRQFEWLAALWPLLTAPLIAWALHAIAMWAWHVPRLYTLALNNPLAHVAEHLSFVGTAGLMWWGFLYPRRSRRAAYALGIGALFLTMLHSGALGALLTLSHRVWFPVHAAGAASFGITPLDDQRLAGLIMWVPGGLLDLAAMSVLFLAWMRTAERRDATRTRGVVTSPVLEITTVDEARSARCESPI